MSVASRTGFSTLAKSSNAPCRPKREKQNDITARSPILFHFFARNIMLSAHNVFSSQARTTERNILGEFCRIPRCFFLACLPDKTQSLMGHWSPAQQSGKDLRYALTFSSEEVY